MQPKLTKPQAYTALRNIERIYLIKFPGVDEMLPSERTKLELEVYQAILSIRGITSHLLDGGNIEREQLSEAIRDLIIQKNNIIYKNHASKTQTEWEQESS